ncbi:MAG: recombinase family protein [Candidatus Doudnabacteria bacterium]|nr:recombinase family protein [Candidatus Doudnabacteria bacterium]
MQGTMTEATAFGLAPSTTMAVPVAQIKYCLYARKSTEQEEKQILSIDSQIKEMLQAAQRDGLNIVEIRRESHSAKASGQRPVFNELVTDIRSGKFNAILTWAPDRLSRNAGDLGSLVDLMDQKLLLEIRTNGQRFSNNPNEKFLLMILCSQAKLENDNKSINVKRGMRARVEMGLWPGCAPTGYLNEKRSDRKCQVMVDIVRAPVVKQIFQKFGDDGWSGLKIYRWLKDDIKFTTKNGKRFMLSNVYLLLRNPFYSGVYEYPRASGNWYTGKHDPIISKELYQKVQAKLGQDKEHKTYTKEFAFTKLIACGLCGSGVSACEKFKPLKDGTINRYVYYGCGKKKDLDCKAGYVREELLIEELLKIMDQVTLDELNLKAKIKQEVERYSEFRNDVLQLDPEQQKKQLEIESKNYAKYILRKGSVAEKRDLLSCLRSKLIFKDKKLELAS